MRPLRLLAVAVLVASIGLPTHAQDGAAEYSLRKANVQRGSALTALSAPSRAAPEAVIGGYLKGRGATAETVGSLRSVSTGKSARGITHVRMDQEFAGLPVIGSYVKAAINPRGELIHLIDRIAPISAKELKPATIGERQALYAALDRLHPNAPMDFRALGKTGNVATFAGGNFFYADPSVAAVAVPAGDGSMATGFLVETWTSKGNLLHHTLVSGDGQILNVELRTANDSYRVFVEDPDKGAQQVVNGPAPGSITASPAGWLGSGSQTTINISGNNANAYLDTDANNRADPGGTVVTNGAFQTFANLAENPSTTTNREVAVQNLFYFNNFIHDRLYGLGFNEAAGNFQLDNFGRGGAGRDPVKAEAQDGSGTDNANFATPRDGRSPRMQMFLWTGAGATHEVVEGSDATEAMGAQFGPALSTTGIAGAIQLVNDGVGTTSDACEAIVGSLSGKIALVDRGTCNFTVKVMNAQAAGAIGVIVANNVTTSIFTMGGSERRIKIPSIMVRKYSLLRCWRR